jgi:hypothetical protein
MSKGINKLSGKIIILEDCKFDYTSGQVRKFIKLWNEGLHLTAIAEKFSLSTLEMALLTMHCDLNGWIDSRPGGAVGSIERGLKKRGRKAKSEKEQNPGT